MADNKRRCATFEQRERAVQEMRLREMPMLLPGEAEAIETVKRLGARYGYGNLIHHLRDAWSERLQTNGSIPALSKQSADLAAGHICVWCYTDSRTGKKVEFEGS